jgi:hypothetical protein
MNMGYTTPMRTPYAMESAQVALRGGRVYAPASTAIPSGTATAGSRPALPMAAPGCRYITGWACPSPRAFQSSPCHLCKLPKMDHRSNSALASVSSDSLTVTE